jgi:3-oxoacyl-[acyl-carrier protein] reductase
MKGLMEGRAALVTGGSRGIGAAAAALLARHGAGVAFTYTRSEDRAQAVAAGIAAAGGRAVGLRADARDAEAMARVVREAEAALAAPIDTLVLNAAGGGELRPGPALSQPPEAWQAFVGGQLDATLVPARAVVPGMIARGHGCVVAVSSGWSRHPSPGFSPVAVAKGALDALVRSLALELGPLGIRVNAVSPGMVLTELSSGMPDEARRALAARTPLGRVARPEDVAGAILLLAAGELGFVTGASLPVDGGMTLS